MINNKEEGMQQRPFVSLAPKLNEMHLPIFASFVEGFLSSCFLFFGFFWPSHFKVNYECLKLCP